MNEDVDSKTACINYTNKVNNGYRQWGFRPWETSQALTNRGLLGGSSMCSAILGETEGMQLQIEGVQGRLRQNLWFWKESLHAHLWWIVLKMDTTYH